MSPSSWYRGGSDALNHVSGLLELRLNHDQRQPWIIPTWYTPSIQTLKNHNRTYQPRALNPELKAPLGCHRLGPPAAYIIRIFLRSILDKAVALVSVGHSIFGQVHVYCNQQPRGALDLSVATIVGGSRLDYHIVMQPWCSRWAAIANQPHIAAEFAYGTQALSRTTGV